MTISTEDRRIDVLGPADGRVLATVDDMRADEVSRVAIGLRAAQGAWEEVGPRGRSTHLLSFLDWIMDNEERLAQLLQQETGRSFGDATFEVVASYELINYYACHASSFLADRLVRPAGLAGLTKRLQVLARPYPLVGIITPWNSPFFAPLLDGVPALLAGAAVLFKPSELAPLTWMEATRGWLDDVGCPPIIGTVSGGPETGAAVVDQVDMIMFTGSTETGRKIGVRAAERLIPCSLELGGKDAMIVLSDANLERAAGAAVWGSMFNAGQGCIAVERVYVEAPVFDDFVTMVVNKALALRVGTDPEGSFATDIGAMQNSVQLQKVRDHVDDAVKRGARVVAGGRERDGGGHYFEPTVLLDVDHSMLCMREETFGPILPIMRVVDEDEAVRLANDSAYGLSASVWTNDARRADRVARQVDAGAIDINNALVHAVQLPVPVSGWKDSGLGSRAGGAAGMLKFCRQKSVVTERLRPRADPHWYPHGPVSGKLQARAVRLLGAHDWRRRLGLPAAASDRSLQGGHR